MHHGGRPGSTERQVKKGLQKVEATKLKLNQKPEAKSLGATVILLHDELNNRVL